MPSLATRRRRTDRIAQSLEGGQSTTQSATQFRQMRPVDEPMQPTLLAVSMLPLLLLAAYLFLHRAHLTGVAISIMLSSLFAFSIVATICLSDKLLSKNGTKWLVGLLASEFVLIGALQSVFHSHH